MKEFVITCSSTCDLSPYYLRQHNMYYVSFYYYINDEKFYDNFYKEHKIDEYYDLIKVSSVKTSQPDPEQYCQLWTKLITKGYDILHIELSSGISGAVNSSKIAKNIIEDKNIDAKIYIIDSLTASSGYGLFLDKIYDYKMKNNNIDDTFKYAEELKHKINVTFLVENLDQLIKGGRVSKVAGSIGKALNIVPILHVDRNGKLSSVKNVRGLNNAMDEIVKLVSTEIDIKEKVFITNANCIDNAKIMASKIKEKFSNVDLKDNYIYDIGTVIGGHTGKGCIAIAYIKSNI